MRSLRRVLFCLLVVCFALTGAQFASAAQHQTDRAVKVLHYDASGAPTYQKEIATAVKNWNGDVRDVRLAPVESGQRADFTIGEDADWPRTYPGESVGTGKVIIGKQAVDQGFEKVRIAAHEIGHILGLPDNRDGQCTTLMSGHSAPVACTNAHPNDAEKKQVEQNFAAGFAVRAAQPAAQLDCYRERAAA